MDQVRIAAAPEPPARQSLFADPYIQLQGIAPLKSLSMNPPCTTSLPKLHPLLRKSLFQYLWKHRPLLHCSCTTLLIVDLSFGVQPFHHCLSNLFDDTGAPVWRLNLHKSNAANERLADGLCFGRNGPRKETSGQDALILTVLATMRKKTRLAAVP